MLETDRHLYKRLTYREFNPEHEEKIINDYKQHKEFKTLIKSNVRNYCQVANIPRGRVIKRFRYSLHNNGSMSNNN